jgi:hypothetical protein
MPELDSNSNPPLSRVELLRLAQGLGVVDADVMTRAELRAAIDKAQRPERPAPDHPHPVTWVSVARRLLASVVERGLNLPDAAALIRGDTKLTTPPLAPPPVATVTLARISAAQGHHDRAIATLDEVLESDPDHELARDLRTQLDLRRTELAQREGAPALARAAAEDAEAARQSNGHALSPSEPPPSEPPPARASDDALTPEPPPVASVDAAAELVAPSFDTVERLAAHDELAPFPPEPPALVGALSLDLATPAAPHVGESEASAALAAGVDWQIENDSAASADVIPEADAPAWGAPSAIPSPEAAGAEPAAPAASTTGSVEAGSAAATEASGSEPAASSHAMNGVAHGIAPAPASVREPAGVDSGAAVPAPPDATPEPPPRVPGLLLIETDTPVRYIYWELVAAGAPHWIHVVTHTPTGPGATERRERRFPVHRQLGALRLEGVPRQAVVRAKLTGARDDARPLVVAGAVRPRSLANGDSFEVRFAPHGKAAPEALAGRARPLLEGASRVYWD